jgi:hypothetical protein
VNALRKELGLIYSNNKKNFGSQSFYL